MRTIEKETTQAGTANIDHGWDNSNNGGVAWYVYATAQAGTANFCMLHNDGTTQVVQSDAVAADSPTVIAYDFPVAKAVFRWIPGGTTPSVLTSRLTAKPTR